MGCHAPAEDVEEDDRQFLAAAREDATLVAHLLLHLSRSETSSSPGRQLFDPASPSAGAADDLPLPDPPKWGQRRPRSRCPTMDGILAAKREEARRSSPTTPLSWSGGGGSWTSGSVCESTPPPRPPKRRKQPDSASRHDVVEPWAPSALAKGPKPEPHEDWGHGPAPPCKWKKTEAACKGGSPRGPLVAVASVAVGSASSPGSTKTVAAAAAAAAAVGGPPRAVAHVEPLRRRETGEGTSSVAVRRPGRKKTVPELKALNESLLQEQVDLRKDLEEQKKVFEALLAENIRLKNLESGLAFHKVGEPTVNPAAHREAESEEPQQPQGVKEPGTAADHPEQVLPCTSPPNPVPQRAPLFDLNCPPDDGLL